MATQGKINNSDILDALNIIKNVCESQKCCYECPLRFELVFNACYILFTPHPPMEWELNKNNEDNNWLAFMQEN